MKLVSWNVNGIRAAWGHGLAEFMKSTNADIYAFQETKIPQALRAVELDGYYPYWSFPEHKKGYSGTVVLTRYLPLKVCYDFHSVFLSERIVDDLRTRFIYEGRIITLEFPSFYFVNCYFPNSQGSQERYDYRVEWDRKFLIYLNELLRRKSVILCGDFNVAISDDDIYPENKWQELNAQGYQATEREALLSMIELGMIDTFRFKNPETEHAFTWWSNRRKKRSENRGWRLDYFLASFELQDKIREAAILSDIYGSDHCPILLDVDIAMTATPAESDLHRKAGRYELPVSSPFERTRFVNRFSNAELGAIWDSIDWETVEQSVAGMQMALAKVAYSRKRYLIEQWQRAIVNSIDARLLAVRHVASTAGGRGVDKVVWTSSKEKMAAALSLTAIGYRAMPARLLLVKSKNGKTRRIHIETWYDRAMQTLYALALDPVAESWGERKSYAFRKGRSHFDAHAALERAFDSRFYHYYETAPEWALVADIRQCYEHISHDWIETHIPLD